MSDSTTPRRIGQNGQLAAAMLGFLGRFGLVVAGLVILAIPDWVGIRVSRFRWEDNAGVYALAGFTGTILVLILARLWAAWFDAGIADEPPDTPDSMLRQQKGDGE